MEEDTVARTKGVGGKLLIVALTILGTGLASILGWVGRSFDAKIEDARKRLEAVEAAEAKWGTFAELKQESRALSLQAAYDRGRLDTLSEMMKSMVGGGQLAKAQSVEEIPEVLRKPEPRLPIPKPEPIDPEEFRNAQQQKYQRPKK